MKTRNLAAAALALGLSACAAQSSAVSIYSLCSPPAPDASGACLYPATCDATLTGTPMLDAETAKLDFRLPVEFRNLLTDNSSAANGRVNTNDAFVQSLEITYSGGGSAPPWNPSVTTVAIPTAGSASALLSLIPVTSFAALAPSSPAGTAHVVVNVRAHGVLASQDAFTTAWFQIPVDVCIGCLQQMLTCAVGSFPAYCPRAAVGETSVGQTASGACITP
jgi:hypothetical protein